MKKLLCLAVMALSGCAWNGSPKTPVDAVYAECKRTCKTTCAADGTCLPPVLPAEDGK